MVQCCRGLEEAFEGHKNRTWISHGYIHLLYLRLGEACATMEAQEMVYGRG